MTFTRNKPFAAVLIGTCAVVLLTASGCASNASTSRSEASASNRTESQHVARSRPISKESANSNGTVQNVSSADSISPASTGGSYKVIAGPVIADTELVARRTLNITVPRGLSNEQLAAVLERASRETADSEQADAVMVFAYANDGETTGPATAGRGVLAYGGNWNALPHTSEPLQFRMITVAPGYARTAPLPFAVGEVVTVGKPGETIQSFPTKEAALALGKSARLTGPWDSVVFDHVRQVTPYDTHHWYRVRLPYADDDSYKGWIHHGHLHAPATKRTAQQPTPTTEPKTEPKNK